MNSETLNVVLAILMLAVYACQFFEKIWKYSKTKTFDLIKADLVAGVFGLAAFSILFCTWFGHLMSIGAYMLLGVLSCVLFLCQYHVENASSKWALEKLLFSLFLLALTVNVRIAEAFLLTSH